jgi:mono/diheme cytochrome c family protein
MGKLAQALPALVALAVLAHPVVAAEPTPDLGRSIYHTGRLASGEPLQGRLQNGAVVSGAAAACVSCHRPSGLGGSEGLRNVRPIAGAGRSPAPTSRLRRGSAEAPQTPAYTSASLARALRDGVDQSGRKFDALMPRYALNEDEAAQLHEYLMGMSGEAPGVDEREIHFATVVAPDVPPESRRAMLGVLRAFFADKNAGTRREAQRRDGRNAGMYRAHRAWVLHEWELQGAPDTWHAQLAAAYRRQPVFAVIGGLGQGLWAPVHAFCEETEVPCVFPDVDYPGGEGTGHYTVYFSRGVALEADVLALQLAERRGASRIVQVYRDTYVGRAAADALNAALRSQGMAAINRAVGGTGPPSAAFWDDIVATSRATTLVVWLNAADSVNLGKASTSSAESLEDVYLSASLAGVQPPELPPVWQSRLRVVLPFTLPSDRAQRLSRLTSWLAAKKIPFSAERAQANAFFAVTVAADAVAHLAGIFSRDYFIERIELMAENPAVPSIYPHPSLGPGQRYASRGAYILGFPEGATGGGLPLRNWTVP